MLNYLVSLYLHHGAGIHLPCVPQVIQHADEQDGAGHEHAVIHGRGRCRGGGRPEAKEKDDDHVDARESVDRDAEGTGNSPGAPCEGQGLGGVVLRWERIRIAGRADGAGAATP